ncbi:MAG TPA: nucleotide pyrophosphatase/phosphodiesterase family protein [Actinomycetota bacterium]|nr:nucleotide pyrophosphatase/phosphodiesterase family protein [Actinomycetota bacterium]
MTEGMAPAIPLYGEASLAEVVPSVLAALGAPGFHNRLEVEPLPGVCILVVDGLGWEVLLEHRGDAPFLAEAATSSGRAVTTVFPATTSASLASLGTGLPPGQHGLVGYTFAVPGHDRAMNSLQWELYGIGPFVDLRTEFPPEEFQPMPTVLERAASEGFEVTLVGPSAHAASGLTRAILRGGRYVGADTLEQIVDSVAATLTFEGMSNAYAYHPFLDTFGHLKGVASDEWREHLLSVDRAAQAIYERLPSGFALVVTADHGMVNLGPEDRIDVANAPELMDGVRLLAGEARARHVHARAGTRDDVLSVWREKLGDKMWVVPKEEAIAAGWFGPKVSDWVLSRIGDVVAAAFAPVGVFQREVDPMQATLIGHHGSMTPVEQRVPLIVVRR